MASYNKWVSRLCTACKILKPICCRKLFVESSSLLNFRKREKHNIYLQPLAGYFSSERFIISVLFAAPTLVSKLSVVATAYNHVWITKLRSKRVSLENIFTGLTVCSAFAPIMCILHSFYFALTFIQTKKLLLICTFNNIKYKLLIRVSF